MSDRGQKFYFTYSDVFDWLFIGKKFANKICADITDQIREYRAFYFIGGRQSRALEILKNEDGSDTLALEALREVLAEGGVIAGSSAGAALMSDPMIAGGSSARALLQGDGEGMSLDQGIGFFPYALTDQHFLARGRLGRLIIATEFSDFDFGFGIDENSGLVVDLAEETATVIGAMGVMIADTRAMVSDPDGARHGIILHYLDPGDSWDLKNHSLQVSESMQLIETGRFRDIDLSSSDIWDDYEAWCVITALPDVVDQKTAKGEEENFDLYFIGTLETL